MAGGSNSISSLKNRLGFILAEEKYPRAADLTRVEKALARLPKKVLDEHLLLMCFKVVRYATTPLNQLTVKYLRTLKVKLQDALHQNGVLSVNQVASLFSCVSRLGDSRQINHDLINIFGKCIYESDESDQFDDCSFFAMFGGLSQLRDDSRATRLLIRALRVKLEQRGAQISGGHAAAALHGLQNFSADNSDVRRILSVLADGWEMSTEAHAALTGTQLSALMFGMKSMCADSNEVQALLELALKSLKPPCNKIYMSEREICTALYGLNKMSSNVPVVRVILDEFSDRLAQITEPGSAQFLSMGIYGLQNKSESQEVTIKLVKVLSQRASSTNPSDWTPKRLAAAFIGTKTMRGTVPEIKSMLAILNSFMRDPSRDMQKDRTISRIMYSLHKKNSSSAEVREILRKVTGMLNECTSRFTAQGISNMIYSMNAMRSTEIEVVEVVSALAVHVKNCLDTMSSDETAALLYGMQGLSSNVTEVSTLIKEVATFISVRSSDQKWSGLNVSNAMYGMRSMSDKNIEVCRLMRVLKKHFDGCSSALDAHQIGRAYYGMRGMSGVGLESRRVLHFLNSKLAFPSVKLTYPAALNCLKGTDKMAADYSEYIDFVKVIKNKIIENPDKIPCHDAREAVNILIRGEETPTEVINIRRDLAIAIILKMEKYPEPSVML